VGNIPDLLRKRLDEISAGLDCNWKLLAITSYPVKISSSSCPFEFHYVDLSRSTKNLGNRFIYLAKCVFLGVRLVSKENIQVITQHDGHFEYGIVAYIISRLTHRKCVARINEDTLIPFLFFLKDSQSSFFKSRTVLRIIATVYRSLEHQFLKHVDWVVTHGPMDYDEVKRLNSKITFVPLWVDLSRFKRVEKNSTDQLRKELGISEDKKILLFVGRLHPEKGVDTLIRALGAMKNKNLVLVLIYSYADYKPEYERLAKELGVSDQVRFIGYLPNNQTPRYYSLADLYVLPSLREEWSNSIMEAMACETPVVATNVGGNPYLITDNKTGYLVPSRDPDALAVKMAFVLANQDAVEAVVKNAAIEIRKYNKERISDIYRSVIVNLLKSSS
jgi:glycosyltransferase involved in cell wall biosynthesis